MGQLHQIQIDLTIPLADGVETEEQANMLRQLGCDHAQGYLFDPALPAEEFARRWLSREGADASLNGSRHDATSPV